MDLNWRLRARHIEEARVREAALGIAAAYAGVEVSLDREAPDCLTLYFSVPWGEDAELGYATVEVNVYDLDRDGVVLSLEGDACDNDEAWDDAAQIAEDLADALDGEPLDL